MYVTSTSGTRYKLNYLVEFEPGIYYGTRFVHLEVLPGDVIHDGFVASLVGDEVHVVAEVVERRQWLRVLQARHAWWLGELVVVIVVVYHHVDRRGWTGRHTVHGTQITQKTWEKINMKLN